MLHPAKSLHTGQIRPKMSAAPHLRPPALLVVAEGWKPGQAGWEGGRVEAVESGEVALTVGGLDRREVFIYVYVVYQMN